jgi:hypothetical protein
MAEKGCSQDGLSPPEKHCEAWKSGLFVGPELSLKKG